MKYTFPTSISYVFNILKFIFVEMIFVAVQAMSSLLLWTYLLRPKPLKSFGILSYFDSTFLDWSSRLLDYSIIENESWLLKCPSFLSDCCPVAEKLRNDDTTLRQLASMTPCHGFSLLLIRKLAETIVSLAACWIPVFNLVAFIYAVWLMLNRQTIFIQNKSRKYIERSYLKAYYFLVSVVPLSIALPLLVEIISGGALDYQLKAMSRPKPTAFSPFWKFIWRDEPAPSISDFFGFFGLMETFYAITFVPPTSALSAREKLCLQTSLSLEYWSVLVFLALMYWFSFLVCKIVVIYPLKFLFWMFFSDYSAHTHNHITNKLHVTEENEETSEYCKQKILKPGDRRSCILDFSTNLPIEKDLADSRQKLIAEFDKYEFPDPEFLFSEEGDSGCYLSSKKARYSGFRRPELGDSREAHDIPELDNEDADNRLTVVVPRYVTRGTSACLDSSEDSA